jgi:predicted transcriptional regulator
MVKDIEANGQKQAIVLYEGKILDGRHRYEACMRLGRQPRTREFGSDESDGSSATRFAHSMNDVRRHVDKAVLAALAVDAVDEEKIADAKGRRTGRPSKVPLREEGLSDMPTGETIAASAAEFGVSAGYAYRAQTIKRDAPEVFERVKAGEFKSLGEAEREAGVAIPPSRVCAAARDEYKPEAPKSKPRREAPDAKGAPLHERSYLDHELRARVVELIGEGRSQSEVASILEFGDAAYLSGAVGGFKRPSDSVSSKVSQIRRELLPAKAESPLAGKVKLVEAMAEDFKSWGNKLDDPQWSEATPAQVSDLCAHVDSMMSAARKFLSKVSKEVQS